MLICFKALKRSRFFTIFFFSFRSFHWQAKRLVSRAPPDPSQPPQVLLRPFMHACIDKVNVSWIFQVWERLEVKALWFLVFVAVWKLYSWEIRLILYQKSQCWTEDRSASVLSIFCCADMVQCLSAFLASASCIPHFSHCAFSAGATACTPCSAGSYSASEGAFAPDPVPRPQRVHHVSEWYQSPGNECAGILSERVFREREREFVMRVFVQAAPPRAFALHAPPDHTTVPQVLNRRRIVSTQSEDWYSHVYSAILLWPNVFLTMTMWFYAMFCSMALCDTPENDIS